MQHRARKRFGQNFLTDRRVIERIVNTIRPAKGELVLEIGPGQAALSEPLSESGAELHLLEIDRDLAVRLQSRFASGAGAQIHTADALKVNFSELLGGRPFRLVGNLPYNISTPLLFHVLQWKELITDMHFMLQQEVVRRMAAGPGSKAWGKLSVMCQYHCEVTALFNVPPEAFTPAPKVQSTFVRLVPHDQPPVRIEDMRRFERVVSQAFSMRRKTLRNSLRGMLGAESIESAGIDPGLRPEALGLEQFAELSNLPEHPE
jgi:16S rRNA (adenine1518-N6/adenine1519-N6)-dimethyltransferase